MDASVPPARPPAARAQLSARVPFEASQSWLKADARIWRAHHANEPICLDPTAFTLGDPDFHPLALLMQSRVF